MPRTSVLLALVLAAPGAPGQPPRPDAETLFEVKVRPVLAGTCFPCHGGKKVGGGLRVDSRAALLKGGDGGPAVVPGDPDGSPLLKALRHAKDADVRMPPDRRLPDAVVADFVAWVRHGAAWPVAAPGITAFAYE